MITLLRQDTGEALTFQVVTSVNESNDGRFNVDTNVDRREITRGYTDLGEPVSFTAVVGPIEAGGSNDPDRVARVLAWLRDVKGGGPNGTALLTYQRRNRPERVDLAVESFSEAMRTLDMSDVSVSLRVQRFAVEGTVSASLAAPGTAPQPSAAAQDEAPDPEDVGARSTSFLDEAWQRAEVGYLRSGAVP